MNSIRLVCELSPVLEDLFSQLREAKLKKNGKTTWIISNGNVSCISAFLSRPVQSSVCPLGYRSAPGQPAGSWWLHGSDYFSLGMESISPIRRSSPNVLPWHVSKELCKRFWAGKESPSGSTRESVAPLVHPPSPSSLSSTFHCPPSKPRNHVNGLGWLSNSGGTRGGKRRRVIWRGDEINSDVMVNMNISYSVIYHSVNIVYYYSS